MDGEAERCGILLREDEIDNRVASCLGGDLSGMLLQTMVGWRQNVAGKMPRPKRYLRDGL